MKEAGAGRKSMTEKYAKTDEVFVFFDTNILVYTVDERNSQKQNIARDLIEKAIQNHNGIISTQTLQEFYNVAIKKLKCPKEKAKILVKMFSECLSVSPISVPIVLNAIDISINNQISIWDSLMLSSANDTGCIIIYSEDMNNGQIINGTKILNPFGEKVA